MDAFDPSLFLDIADASTLKQEMEIKNISCVTINTTASEKFVSLLRRTAAHSRDNSRADDETLIRHVYDLHLIYGKMSTPENLKPMIQQVIEIDKAQFGNQHDEFVKNATAELRHGMSLLTEERQHQERYNQFIGPLVYHTSPAPWSAAISSVQSLAKLWL